MPVFDPTQLVGKTFFENSPANYYLVLDINSLGDNAKPKGKVTSFVMDSYLLPTPAYTSSYGINYAARKYTYFTFFLPDGNYYAVRYEAGNTNTDKLAAQGALTVAQQIEQEKEDQKNIFEKFFSGLNIGGTLKTIIIVAVIILLIVFLLPTIKKGLNNK